MFFLLICTLIILSRVLSRFPSSRRGLARKKFHLRRHALESVLDGFPPNEKGRRSVRKDWCNIIAKYRETLPLALAPLHARSRSFFVFFLLAHPLRPFLGAFFSPYPPLPLPLFLSDRPLFSPSSNYVLLCAGCRVIKLHLFTMRRDCLPGFWLMKLSVSRRHFQRDSSSRLVLIDSLTTGRPRVTMITRRWKYTSYFFSLSLPLLSLIKAVYIYFF